MGNDKLTIIQSQRPRSKDSCFLKEVISQMKMIFGGIWDVYQRKNGKEYMEGRGSGRCEMAVKKMESYFSYINSGSGYRSLLGEMQE